MGLPSQLWTVGIAWVMEGLDTDEPVAIGAAEREMVLQQMHDWHLLNKVSAGGKKGE